METKLKKSILGTALVMMAIGFLNTSLAGPHGKKHAKATKQKYYYYPKQNMYFSPMERTYYVWDKHDRHWVSSNWGPAIYLSEIAIFPRVTLYMATAHPYYYNESHCEVYRKPHIEVRVPVRPVLAEREREPHKPIRPGIQVNIELSPVHMEKEPVYVIREHDDDDDDHHHGNGHAYGHHKGNGHHHGHDRH